MKHMRRRPVLGTLAASVAGSLAGCLGSRTEAGIGNRSEWQSDVVGRVETVANGRVLGDESHTESDGGVFSLDIETGEHQWSSGSTSGFSGHSGLAIADAIYFGWGNDAIGNGRGETYAIEFDGTERWTQETGSVYDAPIVVDDVVYVGSDDGTVRALDSTSGAEHWRTPIEGAANVNLLAVSDAVYVEADRLAALDLTDGEILWSIDRDNRWLWDSFVVEDVVYVIGDDGVRAVANGKVNWHVSLADLGEDRENWLPSIRAVDADRVYVNQDHRLHALSTATGKQEWVVEEAQHPTAAIADDTVYVLGPMKEPRKLLAVEITSGDIRWQQDLGNGGRYGFLSAQVVEGHMGDDHALFVSNGAAITRFNPAGERTWEWTPEKEFGRRFTVDVFVYVGTEDGVVALDPR